MALPDYLKYEVGTPKTWNSSGGDYGITLTSLANGAGAEGAKGDLGANRARLYSVLFTSSVGSAATAGNEIELWWGASTSSVSGTSNPGNLSGVSGAYSSPDEYKLQLTYIGSLILSNAAGTAVQKQTLVFSPPTRYGMPAVVNKSGQTLGSTAADHQIVITPIEEAVEDTI
jgi:hypothetical protein